MVAVRQAGGPGGRGGFRFRWDGARVRTAASANVAREMARLAADLEAYLRSTLHRDTGEMADKAFATVDIVGDRIVVRAGSDAPHTLYHELIYHPQLRQSMDIWAPRVAAAVRAALRAVGS